MTSLYTYHEIEVKRHEMEDDDFITYKLCNNSDSGVLVEFELDGLDGIYWVIGPVMYLCPRQSVAYFEVHKSDKEEIEKLIKKATVIILDSGGILAESVEMTDGLLFELIEFPNSKKMVMMVSNTSKDSFCVSFLWRVLQAITFDSGGHGYKLVNPGEKVICGIFTYGPHYRYNYRYFYIDSKDPCILGEVNPQDNSIVIERKHFSNSDVILCAFWSEDKCELRARLYKSSDKDCIIRINDLTWTDLTNLQVVKPSKSFYLALDGEASDVSSVGMIRQNDAWTYDWNLSFSESIYKQCMKKIRDGRKDIDCEICACCFLLPGQDKSNKHQKKRLWAVVLCKPQILEKFVDLAEIIGCHLKYDIATKTKNVSALEGKFGKSHVTLNFEKGQKTKVLCSYVENYSQSDPSPTKNPFKLKSAELLSVRKA